jgi:uncharacterized membrane protein YfcA
MELMWVAVAGFLASLVDGVLGMGFGPTSSSILLSSGLSPASVSTTVNLAKVATGLAAGLSHWRFGNIDRALVLRLALPGAAGAVIGTTLLANVDGDEIRPFLAVLLMVIGLRILVRFSRPIVAAAGSDAASGEAGSFDRRGTEVVATAGGVTNGLVGAWGPVVTPFLLHRGLVPRLAVGSVNTAEVAVAVVSVASLIGSIGGEGLRVGVVVAMLLGGVIAAPMAAYVVRYIPPRIMGLAVAGLLLFTQSRELANAIDLPVSRWLAYASIPIALAFAVFRPRLGRTRLVAPS